MSNDLATEKQIGFIQRLVAARPTATAVPDLAKMIENIKAEQFTKTGAKALIDFLLAIPEEGARAAATNGSAPSFRTNSYPGKCAVCGKSVAAGAGKLEGTRGAWKTSHLPDDPACVAGQTTAAPCAEGWDAARAAVQAFQPGHYAVPAVSGDNDLTFFEVKVNQGTVNPANKGKHIFNHLVGGERYPVTPAFIVKCLEAAETMGVNESAILYGQTTKRCPFCHIRLTRKYSRTIGYGPDCADDRGLHFDHAAYAASQKEEGE